MIVTQSKWYTKLYLFISFSYFSIHVCAQNREEVLPHGPIAPFNITADIVMKTDTGMAAPIGRLGDKLEVISWHGHKAIRRESTNLGPDGLPIRWEITISDASTLLPYYSEWRRKDGLFLRREFNGQKVTEERSSANVVTSPRQTSGTAIDTVRTFFYLKTNAYDWLGGAGLPILLGIKMHDGMRGMVPVISGDSTKIAPCTCGPCYVVPMTYDVTGPEEIKGLSGKLVKTWKVFNPERNFTFWISYDNRTLEQVSFPGPNGIFVLREVKNNK